MLPGSLPKVVSLEAEGSEPSFRLLKACGDQLKELTVQHSSQSWTPWWSNLALDDDISWRGSLEKLSFNGPPITFDALPDAIRGLGKLSSLREIKADTGFVEDLALAVLQCKELGGLKCLCRLALGGEMGYGARLLLWAWLQAEEGGLARGLIYMGPEHHDDTHLRDIAIKAKITTTSG